MFDKFLRSKKTDYALGGMLVLALFGFEIYNFSTTEYALSYFHPHQAIFGVRWAVLLAFAACLTDFAGIVAAFIDREFQDIRQYMVWAGWLMSASLNAFLTWWAAILTMAEIPNLGNEIASRGELLQFVPIALAILVWLIRISLIGAVAISAPSIVSIPKAKVAKVTP